eukprot:m.213637 g.213637  ORF g.213637 m.213637 type:complete len:110 (-) comp15524_c0_seq10:1008-1337(-)
MGCRTQNLCLDWRLERISAVFAIVSPHSLGCLPVETDSKCHTYWGSLLSTAAATVMPVPAASSATTSAVHLLSRTVGDRMTACTPSILGLQRVIQLITNATVFPVPARC